MAESGLAIETAASTVPAHQVFRLRGVLGFETVPTFLEAARRATGAIVIVDLGNVSFVDSAGLSALIQVHVWLGKEKRRLAIVAPNQRVVTLFEIARVGTLLSIFPTQADAEAALA